MSECHSDLRPTSSTPGLSTPSNPPGIARCRSPRLQNLDCRGKANSRSKAAARLTYILRDNAHRFGGSRHTDVDVLLESFIAHLMASLIRIKQQGIERINEQTGSEMNARLTFWRYLDRTFGR